MQLVIERKLNWDLILSAQLSRDLIISHETCLVSSNWTHRLTFGETFDTTIKSTERIVLK